MVRNAYAHALESIRNLAWRMLYGVLICIVGLIALCIVLTMTIATYCALAVFLSFVTLPLFSVIGCPPEWVGHCLEIVVLIVAFLLAVSGFTSLLA